jgi:4-hydroxybenzoate polyprenyltransferase
LEEIRSQDYERRLDGASLPRGGTAGALWTALRPRQWAKNLLVLAPLIFSRHLFARAAVADSLLAFALFCLASSAGYLINDIRDLHQDRMHPAKRLRPLAAGRLKVGVAAGAGIVLLLAGLSVSFRLGNSFALALAGYCLVSLAYTFMLKRVVIVDVFAIAAGFVLRAVAGALAIGVEMSSWLLICTTLLALLVGFGKRRHELMLLKEGAGGHRRVLEEYSPRFLDMMIGITAAATVMSYALYTASEETVERFHTRALFLTLPFVLYGVFRYLYLMYHAGRGGDPVETAFGDRATLVNLLLWTAAVVVILYLR